MAENKKEKFNIWRSTPIKYKLGIIVGAMLFVVCVAVFVAFSHSDIIMEETFYQESEYYNINEFQNTLIDAQNQLESYLRNPLTGEEYELAWRTSQQKMQNLLSNFDANINSIGVERYLIVNAIKSGFSPYSNMCASLFDMKNTEATPVEMYLAYETIKTASEYLQQYTRNLQSLALSQGQSTLAGLKANSKEMKDTFIVLMIFFAFLFIALFAELIRSIVTPILRLSQESKIISTGYFDMPDLVVKNRDEIYTLTQAFNQMKHSMCRLVLTLKERNAFEAALHQKELDASETSRLLEQAQMMQLRSQINPHFLFNTLNIISRTARKEKATSTEKLILALARLFRYNLKTDDTFVSLQREINIVNDYMAIQTTRFESRVSLKWQIAPDIEPEKVPVPSFVFQPIVENAIIHGLEPKEKGGYIRIKAHIRNNVLHLFVSDNGTGMDKQTAEKILIQQNVRGDISGIGIGNVKKRLEMLNPDAKFEIHSRKNKGTCVHIKLPNTFCLESDNLRTNAMGINKMEGLA